MSKNEISQVALDATFRMHSAPGPGLLKSVYAAALTPGWRKEST